MMNRIHRKWAWGIPALLLTVGSVHAGDLEVTDARLRLLPGDLPGAGYFTLRNTGEEPVTLVGAESASFERVEMHVSTMKEGMAHMHSTPDVDIAPGEKFEFAPKGHHLMFMKRKKSFAEGDEVEVTLEFEGEESLPIHFTVVSPTSM